MDINTAANQPNNEECSNSKPIGEITDETASDELMESQTETVPLPSMFQTEASISVDNGETSVSSNQSIIEDHVSGPSTSRIIQNVPLPLSSLGTATRSDRPGILRLYTRRRNSSTETVPVNRRYVDLRHLLIKRKLYLLKLKRENLLKEFDLKMKLLRAQVSLQEKKLLIFRKKYRL